MFDRSMKENVIVAVPSIAPAPTLDDDNNNIQMDTGSGKTHMFVPVQFRDFLSFSKRSIVTSIFV
jgi:restriction endonuclease